MLTSGCANIRYESIPVLSPEHLPQADQGVVVLRVIDSSDRIFPYNEIGFLPKSFNQSPQTKIQGISAIPSKKGHSIIFAGPLPPGSYSVNNLSSYYTKGERYYADGMRSDPLFGTFTIKANTVTDLGTIIYYPKAGEDSYRKTLIRLPVQQAGILLDQYFSFYQYDKSQVLSWDNDGFADERESTYLSAVQNPVSFTRKYLADDGYLYILAKLGVILSRSPAGEWSVDAVDTDLNLFAIAKNTQGDLLVGGEEGRVFIKRHDTQEWENISLDFSFEVAEVAFDDNRQPVLLVIKDANLLAMQAANAMSGFAPDWQVVKRFSVSSGWQVQSGEEQAWKAAQDGQRIMSLNLRKTDQGDQLTIYHQNWYEALIWSEPQRIEYQVHWRDLQFSLLPNTEEDSMDVVVDAGKKKIGIKKPGFWSWSGLPSFYIKDKKETQWNDLVTKVNVNGKQHNFRLISMTQFNSQGQAQAIVSIPSRKEALLIKSIDGGQTWVDTEYPLPQAHCFNFVQEITNVLLLGCDGATSDFYESSDEGQQWSHVREHEVF